MGRERDRAYRISGDHQGFLPKADIIRYNSALAGNAYTSQLGVDGLGQAFFLITSSGNGGLQVFIKSSLKAGAESNGFAVSFSQENANDVSVDEDAKTIVIEHTAAATLAQLKALIDAAATGLESRYYDGQTGTGTVTPLDLVTRKRARPPVDTWIRIHYGWNRSCPHWRFCPKRRSGVSCFQEATYPVELLILPAGERAVGQANR